MDKRKVLLTAAIAGLFAAGAVMNQAAPVMADDTAAPATGDKQSCKGGSCKGDEGAAKTDAAGAPAGDKKSCKGAEGGKAKKGGKHKAKGKAKKKDDAAAAPSGG
jgi:hypothetical protein